MICTLCGAEMKEYESNNAYPFRHDDGINRCCCECDIKYVTPMRIFLGIFSGTEIDKLVEEFSDMTLEEILAYEFELQRLDKSTDELGALKAYSLEELLPEYED